MNAPQPLRFREPFPYEIYLPPGSGPHPLVCITPILGRFLILEDLHFERRFARFFAKHGLATALIDRPIFEFDPKCGLEQIQEYLEQSLSRNKKVLDSVLLRKDIDPKRIGSFGMSFGAVVNCLWGASDSRIKTHVLAMAGGNLPEIFMTSRDPLMKSYMKAVLESKPVFKNTAVDRTNLKEVLKEIFLLEPLNSAHLLPAQNILLLLAIFDHVVKFRYGMALRQALGKPKTIFLPLGHYTSILLVPILQWQVLKFFQKKL